MAAISWRKWPDPLVDFGRELYIPWQLASGKVLYRDIACLFGPFSQYLNALWFKLFGVSLSTLIFCNLAILAGMTILIYRLLADATDRLTATTAGLTLLLLFAFSEYTTIGNYNFVCPYSHEATHGTALAVAMIFCLSKTETHLPGLMHLLAGLCLGFVMLTKAETSLAACAVVVVWLILCVLVRPPRARFNTRLTLVLLLATAVPMVGFFGTDPRYGKKIMDWIKDEYEDAKQIGYEPLKDGRFGIKILKRRAAAAPASVPSTR
ncbi:MAG: glycosyltransferase family 39 protein [Planctomycetota bacterium]